MPTVLIDWLIYHEYLFNARSIAENRTLSRLWQSIVLLSESECYEQGNPRINTLFWIQQRISYAIASAAQKCLAFLYW